MKQMSTDEVDRMRENGAPRLLPRRRSVPKWSGFWMSGWGALLRDCALCALAGFALAGMRIAGTALPLAACLCAVLPTGLRPVFAAAGRRSSAG